MNAQKTPIGALKYRKNAAAASPPHQIDQQAFR
jgi:hypothetical protein